MTPRKKLAIAIIALSLTILSFVPAYADTFVYDALGRLIRIESESGTITTFTYDANGNLTNVSVTGEAPTQTPLSAPTGLSITGTTLSWDAVNNASGYRVYTNGQARNGIVTATSFDLATLGLATGTHAVQVRAVGNGTTFTDSPRSAVVSFTVQGIVQPGFNLNIINNAIITDPQLVAMGTMRMWPQLNGINALTPYAQTVITAFDQDGNCALEFIQFNRLWSNTNYFNSIDANMRGNWQTIDFTITAFGQTVETLLVNPQFTDDPILITEPTIISVQVNPTIATQGSTIDVVVTTRNMPDGAWVDASVAWRAGLSIVGGPRFYVVDNQATITIAVAANTPVGQDGFSVAARVMDNWGSPVILDSLIFVITVAAE